MNDPAERLADEEITAYRILRDTPIHGAYPTEEDREYRHMCCRLFPRALDELVTLRTAHAALLGVVRDAVRELRETVPPASFQSVTHGQRAINALRALADAAAAEPCDEEGRR